MPQPKQDPFVNSAKFYNLHEYIDRDRSLPLIQEQLNYASAGHLLETYVDALHVALLMDEPSFLIRLKDSPDTIRNPTFIRASHRLPPHYVLDSLGNYLESPSFFVKHIIGEPGEPVRQDHKQASATQFAHEAHAQLRQQGIRFSENVSIKYFPPRGMGHLLDSEQWSKLKSLSPESAVQDFRHAIEEYKHIFQAFSKEFKEQNFSSPITESGKASFQMTPEQKKIVFDAFEASDHLERFNLKLEPIIKKLASSLGSGGLDSVLVEYDGRWCSIDNAPLNPKFPQSTPALLMIALRYVGRHQIDRTFFPQQAFNFQLSVIGVESNVSDNIERLNQRISKGFVGQNCPLADDALFPTCAREHLVNLITTHQKGIQLLHLFSKTAGALEKIYPAEKRDIALQDMAQLLALINVRPEDLQLENPKELATIIFAIERRLRATSVLQSPLYNALGEMLNKAGHLGKRANLADVSTKIKTDIFKSIELIENHDDITPANKMALQPAIILVRQALNGNSR